MTRDREELLLEWDGLTHLAPIWTELARRMGASDRPVRKIRVRGLDARGRRTLASVLGLLRLPEGVIVPVDIDKLCAALGLEGPELRRLVEHVHGPVENRAARRREESLARDALWARAKVRFGDRVPRTYDRLRAAGVPGGDLDAYTRDLDLLADAIDRLPAAAPVPLPMFAWQVCGDPHALDSRAPAGRNLQLAAVELAGGSPAAPDSVTVRRALQEVGIVPDRLSYTTLTSGIRARSDSALGRLLEAGAEARIPVNLSGIAIDRGAPTFEQRRWLCVENPSVIEAAVLERYTGPIVCTSGWPSVDTQRLLDLAQQQGIELHYAGDYDPEGLALAAWMATRYDATIAMTATAYRTADLDPAPSWGTADPSTRWDPDLADAIREARKIVYQEDESIWRRLLSDYNSDR